VAYKQHVQGQDNFTRALAQEWCYNITECHLPAFPQQDDHGHLKAMGENWHPTRHNFGRW
jgi:hypothetical protein